MGRKEKERRAKFFEGLKESRKQHGNPNLTNSHQHVSKNTGRPTEMVERWDSGRLDLVVQNT